MKKVFKSKFLKYGLCLFLAVELLLRVYFYVRPMPGFFIKYSSSHNEYVWVYKKLAQFFQDPFRGETFENVFFTLFIHDPLKGWKARPGLRDFVDTRGKRISTNSKGMRGAREFDYEKPPGKKRVLVLGDSFTFGDEVHDEETYCRRLQEMLGDEYEVINMGMNGYGHDQMLLWLEEEGLKYRPDLIVLAYALLDLERNVMRFWNYSKPVYRLEEGRLELSNVPVPAPREAMLKTLLGPHSLAILRINLELLDSRTEDWQKRKYAVTEAILDEMMRLSSGAGSRFMVVYLPLQFEFTKEKNSPELEFIEAYVKSRGVNFVNPLQTLREKSLVRNYRMWGHYDEKLHYDFAEYLHEYAGAALAPGAAQEIRHMPETKR